MPSLAESLQGSDLGQLRIIARLWGVTLEEQSDQPALTSLAAALIDSTKVNKIISELPLEARAALDDLRSNKNRLPWAHFTRGYGEVREMGAAKRDRERPDEHPVSVSETLWYRALISKAFFDTPSGPEEFAYIPEDLLELMAMPMITSQAGMGRQASALEYAHPSLVNDRIVDHACTILAALRLGNDLHEISFETAGETLTASFLRSLLAASDLLGDTGALKPEPTRQHLEASRGKALLQLWKAWRNSSTINELEMLPDLSLEGNWKNDPLETRQKLLGSLAVIPENTWWSLGAFISAIKQQDPDFQRPAGDYDSWFIRSKLSGEFLRGFEHWDEVDGRLVRYIFMGPLHWLGVLDIAAAEEGKGAVAFRLSGWSKALLSDKIPTGLPAEEEPLVVRSDAKVSARRLVPRRARYQVARFCEWEKETEDLYLYRITPASLRRARQQGLTIQQLLTLFERNARAVPPNLIKALERWDKQGVEARMEQMVVLRVVGEDILQALQKSRASRFLGASVSPTAVAIKPGAIHKVLEALAELGYLGEINVEEK